MAKNLILENISKIYNDVYAVRDANLEIKEGEFLTLLGPSGCGKTTTLRMIAGFEIPDGGKVIYDGKVMNDVIPQNRSFGIVFQSYALFPHLKVFDNVAFGLRRHKYPKSEIPGRVDKLLEMVGLIKDKEKYPPQLSGGMQQRVALARALAPEPEVLLLDEPLSALDAKIRVRLRAEIKQLQVELGITTIYVTHDQEEALSMSDRVVVMKTGVIEQVDEPISIYKKPVSKYVADFVGTSNFFDGAIKDGVIQGENFNFKVEGYDDLDGEVSAAIRPEKIQIVSHQKEKVKDQFNKLTGELLVVIFLGLMVRLVIRIGDEDVIVDSVESVFIQSGVKRGESIDLYLPPDEFIVFQK